jgi:uncharacterized repeat protein (TIGR03847 family)
MPRRRYLFDLPDRFTAGTVGEPGSRTFFLQARDGDRLVSVALEKVQVAVLADRLSDLLDELGNRGIALVEPEASTPDGAPLDEPLREAFRAGTLTLGWDGDDGVVLVEALAASDEDDDEGDDPPPDDEDGPDVLRVRLSPTAARTFVERAVRVVGSGRPPCPLCGQPLDPMGHICPRRNGQYVN